MFHRAGSPLLVLLVLGCLQTWTLALNARGSAQCCFNFFKFPIPVKLLAAYRETRFDCTRPGIVFTLTNGRRLCARPGERWVERSVGVIDRRLLS